MSQSHQKSLNNRQVTALRGGCYLSRKFARAKYREERPTRPVTWKTLHSGRSSLVWGDSGPPRLISFRVYAELMIPISSCMIESQVKEMNHPVNGLLLHTLLHRTGARVNLQVGISCIRCSSIQIVCRSGGRTFLRFNYPPSSAIAHVIS